MKPPRKNYPTRRIVVAGKRDTPTVREMVEKSRVLGQYSLPPQPVDLSHPNGPLLPARISRLETVSGGYFADEVRGDYLSRYEPQSFTCEAHIAKDAIMPYLRGLIEGLPVRLAVAGSGAIPSEIIDVAWFLSSLKVHAISHQRVNGTPTTLIMGYILELYT